MILLVASAEENISSLEEMGFNNLKELEEKQHLKSDWLENIFNEMKEEEMLRQEKEERIREENKRKADEEYKMKVEENKVKKMRIMFWLWYQWRPYCMKPVNSVYSVYIYIEREREGGRERGEREREWQVVYVLDNFKYIILYQALQLCIEHSTYWEITHVFRLLTIN